MVQLEEFCWTMRTKNICVRNVITYEIDAYIYIYIVHSPKESKTSPHTQKQYPVLFTLSLCYWRKVGNVLTAQQCTEYSVLPWKPVSDNSML